MKGVILAAGGFIYNRQMVKEIAPKYGTGMPLGTASDNGSGILLGQSVGGKTDLMDRISAWRFINPPQAFAKGMIINQNGERYINEFMYGAAVGEAMVEENDGVAILIINGELKKIAREQCKPGKAQWFQRAPALLNLWFNSKEAKSVEELAKVAKVPVDALRRTLDEYNDAADGKARTASTKTPTRCTRCAGALLRDQRGHQEQALPLPTLTLGGLVVDERTGQVKGEDGGVIPGLYAAGRNAVGVCSRQYVSGLSIADCVYSGRRAGGAAARGEVYAAKDAPTPVQTPPIEAKGLEGHPGRRLHRASVRSPTRRQKRISEPSRRAREATGPTPVRRSTDRFGDPAEPRVCPPLAARAAREARSPERSGDLT